MSRAVAPNAWLRIEKRYRTVLHSLGIVRTFAAVHVQAREKERKKDGKKKSFRIFDAYEILHNQDCLSSLFVVVDFRYWLDDNYYSCRPTSDENHIGTKHSSLN